MKKQFLPARSRLRLRTVTPSIAAAPDISVAPGIAAKISAAADPIIARTVPSCACILSITLPIVFTPSSALAGQTATQGFTATLEHRFKPLQQSLMRSDVFVSEHGFRVQSQDTALGHQIITNFVTGNIWFVDNELSIVHELPLNRVEDAPRFPELLIRLPGFIDSIPCFAQDGTHVDDILFHEQPVQRWRCSPTDTDATDNELPVEQYYSNELAMVVYSYSANGLESQLINIKQQSIDSTLFSPSDALRSVGIEEFMGITPPIGTYQATVPQVTATQVTATQGEATQGEAPQGEAPQGEAPQGEAPQDASPQTTAPHES